MISKCANPKCSAVFRYLHEGKLFEFERRSLQELSIAVLSGNRDEKPLHEIECFWLCDSCASAMALVRDPRTHGIVIVPLLDGVQADEQPDQC
jgi:hypothetical protein